MNLINYIKEKFSNTFSHPKLNIQNPLTHAVAEPDFNPDRITNIASDSFLYHSPKHISRSDLRTCLKDDEVASALDTRLKKTTRCQWFLSSENEAEKLFIENTLRPHIESIIKCCWQSILFGYSVAEIIYDFDKTDKKIKIKQVIELPFEWFKFDPDGRLLFERNGQFFDVGIDEFKYKFIAPVNFPTKTNPYGEALLESVYDLSTYRKHGRTFWARWLEKYAMPFLVLKSQGGDFNKLMSYLKNAMRGSAVVLGGTEELEKIETGNNGESFKTFIEHCNTSIQKVILGQINVTETGRSLSEEAFRIASDEQAAKRDSDMTHIKKYIQQVINYLCELNNFTGEITFSFDIENGIGKDRAERDAKLVGAGIVQLTPKYIQRAYDFEDGDFIIATQESQKTARSFSHKFNASYNGVQNAVNKLERAQKELDDAIQSQTLFNFLDDSQIKQLIAESNSEQELIEKLCELLKDTDISKSQVLDLFDKTMFSARLFGFETMHKTISS